MRALLAAALACSGCGTMEAYFAQDVVDESYDISYVDGSDNIRQRLDLFLPRAVDNFPVVVFVHGGYWIHQDKDYYQPVTRLYQNAGIALARHGIGTAVIDYRLVPDVTFDDEFADVSHAIAWTHDHIGERGGDADNMVIVGHSAGGHMTALAAFDEPRLAANGVDVDAIKGYVPLSPILDLHPAPAGEPTIDPAIVSEVFGDQLDAYSPVTYFSGAVKPLLVITGTEDEPFIVSEIGGQIGRLETLGAPVQSAVLPGHSHADIVLDFDTDGDAVTSLVAPFIHSITH